MSARQIEGFDYRLGKQVSRSRREWKEELRKAEAAGARVIRKEGDTLVVPRGASVSFEIWEVVR
jgi:hypothetical protein